jgi:hypothetical protein
MRLNFLSVNDDYLAVLRGFLRHAGAIP